MNKHKSNKIKENSNTVNALDNGTDHHHSKSCCDQRSPARRTIITYSWWRHQMKTFGFPLQMPVMRSFDIFFDLRLNKRLSKQWKCRWFETPSRSLWRHCNVRNVASTFCLDTRETCCYYELIGFNHKLPISWVASSWFIAGNKLAINSLYRTMARGSKKQVDFMCRFVNLFV